MRTLKEELEALIRCHGLAPVLERLGTVVAAHGRVKASDAAREQGRRRSTCQSIAFHLNESARWAESAGMGSRHS